MDEPSFGAGTCHGPSGLDAAYRLIGHPCDTNIKCSYFWPILPRRKLASYLKRTQLQGLLRDSERHIGTTRHNTIFISKS
jgi:hypothetical protein